MSSRYMVLTAPPFFRSGAGHRQHSLGGDLVGPDLPAAAHVAPRPWSTAVGPAAVVCVRVLVISGWFDRTTRVLGFFYYFFSTPSPTHEMHPPTHPPTHTHTHTHLLEILLLFALLARIACRSMQYDVLPRFVQNAHPALSNPVSPGARYCLLSVECC